MENYKNTLKLDRTYSIFLIIFAGTRRPQPWAAHLYSPTHQQQLRRHRQWLRLPKWSRLSRSRHFCQFARGRVSDGACVQTQTVVERGDIDVHAYHRAVADKNATAILKRTTCIEKYILLI